MHCPRDLISNSCQEGYEKLSPLFDQFNPPFGGPPSDFLMLVYSVSFFQKIKSNFTKKQNSLIVFETKCFFFFFLGGGFSIIQWFFFELRALTSIVSPQRASLTKYPGYGPASVIVWISHPSISPSIRSSIVVAQLCTALIHHNNLFATLGNLYR